jgi:hypothetical protein
MPVFDKRRALARLAVKKARKNDFYVIARSEAMEQSIDANMD